VVAGSSAPAKYAQPVPPGSGVYVRINANVWTRHPVENARVSMTVVPADDVEPDVTTSLRHSLQQ